METELKKPRLTEAKKQEFLSKLSSMKGCCKGKSKMSDEEARKLAGIQALRKFGLKLD